jgi:hypothetical protein
MRAYLATFIVGLVLLGAAVPSIAGNSGLSPVAHAACKPAVIEGKHKCIARGQFCRHTKKANRDYHKYGYHCGKKDRNGRYHLVYH